MLKKTMLAAAAIAAMAALVAPTAHAEKTAKNAFHNGAPLASNAVVTSHGEANFTSSAGGIACDTTGSLTLEPGSTGKVTAFDPSSTASCTYSGNLDNLCGTVDAHESTGTDGKKLSSSNAWVAHGTLEHNTPSGTVHKLDITGVHVHVGGTGIFCPNVTVKGNVTLKFVGNPPSSVTIEGTMESNLGTEVEAGGSLSLTPSATYGLES